MTFIGYILPSTDNQQEADSASLVHDDGIRPLYDLFDSLEDLLYGPTQRMNATTPIQSTPECMAAPLVSL